MNIENLLNQAFKRLTNSNVKNANLDCEILLSKTINKNREYIILNQKENLDKKYIEVFYSLIERRKKGEPLAYLLNKKEFALLLRLVEAEAEEYANDLDIPDYKAKYIYRKYFLHDGGTRSEKLWIHISQRMIIRYLECCWVTPLLRARV